MTVDEYPNPAKIREAISDYKVIEINVLNTALELGDSTGRIANVVMMGPLSKTAPLDILPVELWLQALRGVTPHPELWAANYAAFYAGRDLA